MGKCIRRWRKLSRLQENLRFVFISLQNLKITLLIHIDNMIRIAASKPILVALWEAGLRTGLWVRERSRGETGGEGSTMGW
jgi:hypothetical protein